MKIQHGFLLVCLAGGLSAAAQDTPTAADAALFAPPSRAELQQSAAIVRVRIGLQAQQLLAVHQQIINTDRDIEARVDDIVKQLSAITDSVESDTRVADMKKRVIKALNDNIQFYRQQRATLMFDAGSGPASPGMTNVLKVLDARIDKRVDQILTLASSMPERVQNRTSYSDGYDNSYNNDPEADQNEAERAIASHVKRDVIARLTNSIVTLKRTNADMERQLAGASPELQSLLRQEIEENRLRISQRWEQAMRLTDSGGGGARAVGTSAAFQTSQLIQDMGNQLSDEFNKLRSLAMQHDSDTEYLKNLQAQESLIQQQLGALDAAGKAAGRSPAAAK